MKYRFYFIALLLLPIGILAQSQAQVTLDYIKKYKGIAINEMKRTGIPASITLAQAIVESGSGESDLAKKANNHFGIKCKTEWTGNKIYKDDDIKNECFRVYENADSSFIDHSNFLKYRPYYASLFELDPVDDTAWAYGLKKAGYATEKDYPTSLLKVIDLYELSQFNYPELVAEDSLTEAMAINKAIDKDSGVKKEMIVSPTPINKNPLKDTVVKIVTVKDTVVKVITLRDTIVNTVTIKDTIVKILKVKDSSDSKNITTPSENKKLPIKTAEVPVIKYPLNQKFRINQVPAIWGEAGRSFLEIATTYHVDLYKIYTYNELDETDLVIKDQVLFLGEKKKLSAKKVHVAKLGERFYDISQMEGIQLHLLKSYNSSIAEEEIKDGTIIYLFNMPKEPIAPSTSDQKITDTPILKKNKFKLF